MIRLYTFGPHFGQPDPSPFCIKALVLLKMSGQEFETRNANLRKAPKGKAPYIRDGDELIGDTTFIRWYLEERYGVDFDPGLSASGKAIAWAFEKMCEEHIYFHGLYTRWAIDESFDKGPRRFFNPIPALMRPLIVRKVRRDMVRSIRLQGTGRHTATEVDALAKHGLSAISDFLGSKNFLMGDDPCGADASIFGTVNSTLSPVFDIPIRTHVESLDNLVAYNERCLRRWFPDFRPDQHL